MFTLKLVESKHFSQPCVLKCVMVIRNVKSSRLKLNSGPKTAKLTDEWWVSCFRFVKHVIGMSKKGKINNGVRQ